MKVKEFLQAYKEHYKFLYNSAMGFLKKHEIAEELVQDTFTKAYTAEYTKKASVSTWLHRILYNNIMNYLERHEQKKRSDVDVSEFVEPKRVDNIVLCDMGLDRIGDAISGLPHTYRSVARLYFVDDFSYKEVAKRLDITPEAVKTRVLRARKFLQEELTDRV